MVHVGRQHVELGGVGIKREGSEELRTTAL